MQTKSTIEWEYKDFVFRGSLTDPIQCYAGVFSTECRKCCSPSRIVSFLNLGCTLFRYSFFTVEANRRPENTFVSVLWPRPRISAGEKYSDHGRGENGVCRKFLFFLSTAVNLHMCDVPHIHWFSVLYAQHTNLCWITKQIRKKSEESNGKWPIDTCTLPLWCTLMHDTRDARARQDMNSSRLWCCRRRSIRWKFTTVIILTFRTSPQWTFSVCSLSHHTQN